MTLPEIYIDDAGNQELFSYNYDVVDTQRDTELFPVMTCQEDKVFRRLEN